MNFYTYRQLLQQTNRALVWRYGFLVLLGILVILLLFMFLRHRNDSKYRDLLIIVVLSAVLMIGIQINNYKQFQNSLSQNAQIVAFLRSVSKTKQVPLKYISANTTTLTDQMIIRVKKTYYQVNFDSSFGSYQLIKTQLITPETAGD
ncbi:MULTISPECIES: DUF3290 domain-containing protein [Loigolactobacillus]|uniref:DUF3290 domain-containing protein n=1 Tax=Loigolactobacillus TaxID=2767889 RepID=UPI0007F0DB8A|nr:MULTISPECIES: DUF3290 domain-containing protein [Loigolactobacillus]ANK60817.1 hypothetical protein AYR52_11470 [Loigolactobacillus backii]ANK65771.1 hypothetical protein AYR54_11265 [Loigolactobacillus backii]ANK68247.1 hypothetical protein AYR55_11415 [Loigolactobacillus backii]MDA5388349.1 DUF3290 domain-containing protein [Loigolactobacillus backii]MDA5390843.1 DUF3290 domain-containing protein [Loigolactobacillus backii]